MGIFTQNHKGIYFKTSSSSIQYTNGGSDVMTFLSSGNVGIGTTSPGDKLTVDGNISATGTILGSNLSGTNTGDQDLSGYALTSHNHDDRYYTESESDSRFVNVTGDTMSGSLDVNADIQANTFTQAASGIPRNNLGAPTVTEMALFDNQFTPKTTLANDYDDLSDLTFWKQETSSSPWVEITTFSDDQKRRFLRTKNSNIAIPNGVYKFRVEFVGKGYTFANAMYAYWSSQSHNTQVHVWKYNVNSSSWIQHTNSSATVSSWPGHLYLPFSTIPWLESATTHTGHYKSLRIEFTPTWSTGAYSDRTINLYGMEIWGGYPSGRREPHYYDQDGQLNIVKNLSVSGDLKAPIFYDSNNTGYYVNPSSTSVLNHGKFTSTLSFGLYTSGSRGVQLEGYPTHSVVRNDADRLDFYMGNSSGGVGTMMTLTKAGNVGIGTTSPSQKLQVEGSAKFKTVNSTTPTLDLVSTNDADPFLRYYDENAGSTWCAGLDASDGKYKISFDYDNNTVSSGTKLTIATDGKVGIGPTSPSEKLDVSGNVKASKFYLSSSAQVLRPWFGSIYIESSNGVRVQNTSGTLKPVTASAFNTSSDYRLKSNIVPLENAISRLNQLEVHRFNWNDRLDEPKVDGFIAHEVATVIPEAVLGEKDGTFEDGSPDYQGIDQAKIVPLLTAALQEALQKIENLETRIQTLENN